MFPLGQEKFFQKKQVGRGCAVADFNRDGRADLAVSHLNENLVLLENRTVTTAQSLSLKLIGTTSNRSGIGAMVEITTDSRKLTRYRRGSSSYLSADESGVLTGLGNSLAPVTAKVTWPAGKTEIWSGLQPGGRYTLIEGTSGFRDPSQIQQ